MDHRLHYTDSKFPEWTQHHNKSYGREARRAIPYGPQEIIQPNLGNHRNCRSKFTLVNVYVDLLVFTRIAGTVLRKPDVIDIGVNTI